MGRLTHSLKAKQVQTLTKSFVRIRSIRYVVDSIQRCEIIKQKQDARRRERSFARNRQFKMETKVCPDLCGAGDSGRLRPGLCHPPQLLPLLGGELSLHQGPLAQYVGNAGHLWLLRQRT